MRCGLMSNYFDHLFKELKRAGAGLNDDLLNFYCSVIGPVHEYASPVWHFID